MNSTLDKYFSKKPNSNGKRKHSRENEEEVSTENKSKKKSDIPHSPKKPQASDDINSTSEIKTFPSFDEFIDGLGSWKESLKSFLSTEKMKSIYKFINKEYTTKTILPSKELIFNAFDKTSFDNLKVVLIGQDPYPTPGNAMGLSFSVPIGIKIPKSLQNIYKCLSKDEKVKFKAPNHGDLTYWATQGVFLLNATLTVEANNANSHKKSGWTDFTDFVIKTISDKTEGIVFLLWGKYAMDKKKFIDQNKHHIIENIHPSPLAASKGDFTESKQFSEINDFLAKNGKTQIDWSLAN